MTVISIVGYNYYSVPYDYVGKEVDIEGIHKKIRTINIIERSFREVRRRARPMTCFENDASCSRIIFSVIYHLNNNWKDKPLKEFIQKT